MCKTRSVKQIYINSLHLMTGRLQRSPIIYIYVFFSVHSLTVRGFMYNVLLSDTKRKWLTLLERVDINDIFYSHPNVCMRTLGLALFINLYIFSLRIELIIKVCHMRKTAPNKMLFLT